jgi:YggT family protein
MDYVIYFVDTVFRLLTLAIVARIILSWFRVNGWGGFYQFLGSVTEPVLSLARKITPRMGMLDFSPLVALIGLDLLNALIIRILINIQL